MMWIKDYVNKEGGLEYSRLTCLQRYVFDGLCRLRGRFGTPLPNDAAYIATALSVPRFERQAVGKALKALTSCGLIAEVDSTLTRGRVGTDSMVTEARPEVDSMVTEARLDVDSTLTHAEVLSNQRPVEQSREEVEKSKERVEKTLPVQDSETRSISTPVQNETKTKTSAHPASSDTAEAFAEIWQRLMPLNPSWNSKAPSNWTKLLAEDFSKLLARWKPDQLHDILAFSQFGSGQAEYNYTTRNLLGQGASICEERLRRCQRKKDGRWEKILARYNAVVVGEESGQESSTETEDALPAWLTTKDEDGWIICGHCAVCIEPDNPHLLAMHIPPHEDGGDVILGEDRASTAFDIENDDAYVFNIEDNDD